ncbi:hypothetical protein [Megalodesulfovibrio paquesii]
MTSSPLSGDSTDNHADTSPRNLGSNIGSYIANIFLAVKTETAAWKQAHQPELDKLRHDRAVAEVELKHRLAKMDIRLQEECARIRMEEERQTAQFQEFLDSIDEMKTAMLSTYAGMPKPIALMIHHHAAELLKEAWFSQDTRERLRHQTRFTDLMLTITEDLAALDNVEAAGEGAAGKKALPEKTLAFLKDESNHLPAAT